MVNEKARGTWEDRFNATRLPRGLNLTNNKHLTKYTIIFFFFKKKKRERNSHRGPTPFLPPPYPPPFLYHFRRFFSRYHFLFLPNPRSTWQIQHHHLIMHTLPYKIMVLPPPVSMFVEYSYIFFLNYIFKPW